MRRSFMHKCDDLTRRILDRGFYTKGEGKEKERAVSDFRSLGLGYTWSEA
jgi:hypothetical protein